MPDQMIYQLNDGAPAQGPDMIPVSRGATGGNFYVTVATVVGVETSRAEGVEATIAAAVVAETTRAEAAEAAIVATSGATGPAGPTGATGPAGPTGAAGTGGGGGGTGPGG